ncbi:11067_t:CDS:2 [Acaulospora colombiana]|uniref:11067_t:CDS:1 n=1 Tax=Acaulospora colombiana TaxID=27376 RepID=A0ACA9P6A6_9GLOM|nr:11067_t:CDS:2 [Acaulospora colombiana]
MRKRFEDGASFTWLPIWAYNYSSWNFLLLLALLAHENFGQQGAAIVASQEEHVEPPKAAPEAAATTSANTQEPQNRFTEAFTEQEWDGVKKLRALLSEVSEEAYDNKERVPHLWGVELSATSPTAKASVVLVKFIRARQGNLEAAKSMLVSTLKWREEFKVDHLAKEEFPEDVFGKVGVISGKDKAGRPVTYNFYGSVSPEVVFKDVDQFLRRQHGPTASQASQIFSDYYPELLVRPPDLHFPRALTPTFTAQEILCLSTNTPYMDILDLH